MDAIAAIANSQTLHQQQGSTTTARKTVERERPAAEQVDGASLFNQAPASNESQAASQDQQQSAARVQEMIEEVNARLDEMPERSVTFEMSEETEEMVIRIVNGEGEVIREVPPEEILKLRKNLEELRGVLFDKQG